MFSTTCRIIVFACIRNGLRTSLCGRLHGRSICLIQAATICLPIGSLRTPISNPVWKFPSGRKRPSLEPILRTGPDPADLHSLLLDRRDRRAYVSERGQSMIPFAVLFAVMEPEEGDARNVFVDGKVISPGSEDKNLSPASELVDQFRRFLDSMGPGRWPGQNWKGTQSHNLLFLLNVTGSSLEAVQVSEGP